MKLNQRIGRSHGNREIEMANSAVLLIVSSFIFDFFCYMKQDIEGTILFGMIENMQRK